MWPYRYVYDVPLVTLIPNIYGFVGLDPFFLGKNTILGFFFFLTRKGCGHINMLKGDTDSKYIYGFVGLTSTVKA